jgi:hypothetical protein
MTKRHYINSGTKPYYRFRLRSMEEKYNAKYLGAWEHDEFPEPLDIFYVHEKFRVGNRLCEKYFGIYKDEEGNTRQVVVDDVFDKMICGVEADDGEICVSRFEGDHYISMDNSVWVDGGMGMIQTNRLDRLFRIYVNDGIFEFEPLGHFEIHSTVEPSRGFFQIFQWP